MASQFACIARRLSGTSPRRCLKLLPPLLFGMQDKSSPQRQKFKEGEVVVADDALDERQPGHVEGAGRLSDDVQDEARREQAFLDQRLLEVLVDDERAVHGLLVVRACQDGFGAEAEGFLATANVSAPIDQPPCSSPSFWPRMPRKLLARSDRRRGSSRPAFVAGQ